MLAVGVGTEGRVNSLTTARQELMVDGSFYYESAKTVIHSIMINKSTDWVMDICVRLTGGIQCAYAIRVYGCCHCMRVSQPHAIVGTGFARTISSARSVGSGWAMACMVLGKADEHDREVPVCHTCVSGPDRV